MDTFLEHYLRKLILGNAEHMNSLTSMKEIEFIIKNSGQRKSLDQIVLLSNYIKHLRKKQLYSNSLQKQKRKTLPNLFDEASVTLTLKPDRYYIK